MPDDATSTTIPVAAEATSTGIVIRSDTINQKDVKWVDYGTTVPVGDVGFSIVINILRELTWRSTKSSLPSIRT